MSLRKSFTSLCGMLAVVACGATGCNDREQSHKEEPAASMAKLITSRDELIGGPNALGDVGDYLLQNDKIRVIVQRPGYSRGMNFYGGSIIDADIQRGPGVAGKDNFGEMMPIFFLMGMQPDEMTIIDDGATSQKAHIRVTGTPGWVVALITKFYPKMMKQDQVKFQLDYYLEMGKPYVEIHSSVINTDPKYPLEISLQELITLAASLTKAKIDFEIPMPAGDVLLFGAGNYVFIPGIAGYDLQYTLENKLYFEPLQLPALPGLAADFMATSGPGVSYGIFMAPNERNFAMMNNDIYANATDHSLEIPMLMDGLTGAFHTWLPKSIEAGGSFTMVKYFAVGDGDVGSIRKIYQDFYNEEVGTISGQVIDEGNGEPLADMSVVVFDADKLPFSQYFTDENGNFSGEVPPGKYYMRVVAEDRFSTTMEEAVPVEVKKNATSSATLTIGESGKLEVLVSTSDGKPMPAKVVVVGTIDEEHQDMRPMEFLYDYTINERMRPNDLSWTIKDGYGDHQYIEKLFNTANGVLEETVRPGNYTIVVAHGPEWNQYRREVEIKAGETTTLEVTLKHVVNTEGYAGGDMHIHSIASLDSFTKLPDRVAAVAAEGMDFSIATDHNTITNYQPTAEELKVTDWVKPVVGMEFTSFEMGHFNGFPLRYDPNLPVHGVSPWVAPPDEDASQEEWDKYNQLPSYMRKPQRPSSFTAPSGFEWMALNPTDLMDELRSLGKYGPEETAVIVNHPRDTFMGYFNAFNLDTKTGMPRPAAPGVASTLMDRTASLFDSSELNNGIFKCSGFSFNFDAIEVLNGSRMDLLHSAKMPLDATSDELAALNLPDGNAPGQVLVDANGQSAFPGGVDDWFNLLNQGYRYAVVGASDSHRILEDQVGINRTYLRIGEKLVSSLDERELVRALKERRSVVSNGPFISLTVDTDARGNGNGTIGQIGDQVSAANGQVKVQVKVQSAHWIKVDRLVLWVNGEAVKVWDKASGLPGTLADEAYTFSADLVLDLARDSWVVLEAVGDDEGRNSLWPVYTYREAPFTNIANVATGLVDSLGFSMGGWGRFKPEIVQRAYPYALTSPIWIDADGDDEFTPPVEKATACMPW